MANTTLKLRGLSMGSVLFTSLCLGVCLGVVAFGGTVALWEIMNKMGVWDSIQNTTASTVGKDNSSLTEYLSRAFALKFGALFGLLMVVLTLVLGMLFTAFYNLIAMINGGLSLNLAEIEPSKRSLRAEARENSKGATKGKHTNGFEPRSE